MMSDNTRPVILFTNDAGILSPGLWAAVRACSGLGDLLVVAPREQQSGMGRSMPNYSEGRIYDHDVPDDIENCTAFEMFTSPESIP